MAENTMKRPLIKAVFFTFIPLIFAAIAGTVISIMKFDNNSSIIVQSICFFCFNYDWNNNYKNIAFSIQ